MENRIVSYAELEMALNNLTELSEKITKTLEKSQSIYEMQDKAWHSANSSSEANKMMDYAAEADKIAKNIQTVSETVRRFKNVNRNIDEAK